MDDFHALPQSLRRQIDAAFDEARETSPDPVDSGLVPPAAKRRRLLARNDGEVANYHSEDSDEGGGFLVDDEPVHTTEEDQGEIHESNSSRANAIGLSMIPKALQLLDLPPDDEDVLTAFKNAAGGWGVLAEGEESVSRDEWREVTTILVQYRVAGDRDGSERSSGGDQADGEDPEPFALVESDLDDNSEDEYRDGYDDDNGEAASVAEYSSGDQYNGNGDGQSSRGASSRRSAPAKSTRRTRRARSSSASSTASASDMTSRQRAEARKTFALFFPDVPPDQLASQRIMIKDISRVSSLLSIKLKTEEILEMLDAFSTSNDKSITLSDFENLVMATHLV